MPEVRPAFQYATLAQQHEAEFGAVYTQVRSNTLVDIWRCHELWSLLG